MTHGKKFKLALISLAVSSVIGFHKSADATTPVSYYDYAVTLNTKNPTVALNFINSMVNSYSKVTTTYGDLITKYSSVFGGQAWFQNIVNQHTWYQSELAKYQALKVSFTSPTDVYVPAAQPLVSQTPSANAQWYLTTDGRKITVEQLQQETVLTQGRVLAAWARGITGNGVKVAVIDQGFDQLHSDIAGKVDAYKNFYLGTSNIAQGTHGTAMASIIAGSLNNGEGTVGVAPGARLLLAQVGAGGTSSGVNAQAIAQALSWAQQQGADVVNMSLAFNLDKTFQSQVIKMADGMYMAPANYGSLYGSQTSFNQMIAAGNTKSVVVVASGNQGLPYSSMPGAYATQVGPTGNLVFGGRWLIVGSVNANNVISSFSNQAGSLCTNVSGSACLDPYHVKDFYVVAPGERVIVSQDTTSLSDNKASLGFGTSHAAAYVSGGVALLKQAWPQLKASQLVSLVLNTATDLGAPGVDSVYGRGLVNFDKATAPYGDIKYTKAILGSGPAVNGNTVYSTQMSSANITALSTSSVLSKVQVVDELNRNYTVNFTKAINKASPTNALYTSPYLALNASGYKEQTIPMPNNGMLTMMQTTTGVAAQFDTSYDNNKLMMQVGTMAEHNGFLKNSGGGLLGLGDSSTTYMMLGGSVPMHGKVELFGNYGVGVTQTSNVASSLISLSPTIISDTLKIGFSAQDVFFSGNVSDKITLSLSRPVSVRSGKATVSAVTGYTFNGSEDNVTATPIVSSESVNLAGGRKETDLILGYTIKQGNSSMFGLNLAYQTSVAGQAGNNAYAVGFMYNKAF